MSCVSKHLRGALVVLQVLSVTGCPRDPSSKDGTPEGSHSLAAPDSPANAAMVASPSRTPLPKPKVEPPATEVPLRVESSDQYYVIRTDGRYEFTLEASDPRTAAYEDATLLVEGADFHPIFHVYLVRNGQVFLSPGQKITLKISGSRVIKMSVRQNQAGAAGPLTIPPGLEQFQSQMSFGGDQRPWFRLNVRHLGAFTGGEGPEPR